MPDITTPDELIKTVSSIQQHVQSLPDGAKFARLNEAVDAITGQIRDLRKQQLASIEARPAGTDAEALQKYGVRAELVASQIAKDGPVQYASADAATGREFAGSKGSETAVRLLAETDPVGRTEYGLLDDPEPVTRWQAELQWLASVRSLAKLARSRQRPDSGTAFGATPVIDAAIRRHLARGPAWVRQSFADNSGEGAELIPDITLPELARKLEHARSVASLFETMMLPNNGATTSPFLVAGLQPFIVGQPSAGDHDPAMIGRSAPSLSTISAAPKTWGVTLPANRDATEDSIIEYAPMALMMLAEGIRDGKEDAWINADLNGGDTGLANWNPRSRWQTLGAANDHRKSFIGLRHHSIDVSSHGSIATESAVGLIAELPSLDSPHFLGDIVYITSPEWYVLKLLTDTNLLTVDKIGALATLLTGQVGAIGGHPVVVSEFVDKQYNASGIYDDTTKTKTGVLIVNRRRWANGIRRGPRVEVEVVARQHVTFTTVTERWTARHLGQATEKSVSWQYNATAS